MLPFVSRRRESFRIFMECIRANILLVGPYHRTAFRTGMPEVNDILALLEYAEGEKPSKIQ